MSALPKDSSSSSDSEEKQIPETLALTEDISPTTKFTEDECEKLSLHSRKASDASALSLQSATSIEVTSPELQSRGASDGSTESLRKKKLGASDESTESLRKKNLEASDGSTESLRKKKLETSTESIRSGASSDPGGEESPRGGKAAGLRLEVPILITSRSLGSLVSETSAQYCGIQDDKAVLSSSEQFPPTIIIEAENIHPDASSMEGYLSDTPAILIESEDIKDVNPDASSNEDDSNQMDVSEGSENLIKKERKKRKRTEELIQSSEAGDQRRGSVESTTSTGSDLGGSTEIKKAGDILQHFHIDSETRGHFSNISEVPVQSQGLSLGASASIPQFAASIEVNVEEAEDFAEDIQPLHKHKKAKSSYHGETEDNGHARMEQEVKSTDSADHALVEEHVAMDTSEVLDSGVYEQQQAESNLKYIQMDNEQEVAPAKSSKEQSEDSNRYAKPFVQRVYESSFFTPSGSKRKEQSGSFMDFPTSQEPSTGESKTRSNTAETEDYNEQLRKEAEARRTSTLGDTGESGTELGKVNIWMGVGGHGPRVHSDVMPSNLEIPSDFSDESALVESPKMRRQFQRESTLTDVDDLPLDSSRSPSRCEAFRSNIEDLFGEKDNGKLKDSSLDESSYSDLQTREDLYDADASSQSSAQPTEKRIESVKTFGSLESEENIDNSEVSGDYCEPVITEEIPLSLLEESASRRLEENSPKRLEKKRDVVYSSKLEKKIPLAKIESMNIESEDEKMPSIVTPSPVGDTSEVSEDYCEPEITSEIPLSLLEESDSNFQEERSSKLVSKKMEDENSKSSTDVKRRKVPLAEIESMSTESENEKISFVSPSPVGGQSESDYCKTSSSSSRLATPSLQSESLSGEKETGRFPFLKPLIHDVVPEESELSEMEEKVQKSENVPQDPDTRINDKVDEKSLTDTKESENLKLSPNKAVSSDVLPAVSFAKVMTMASSTYVEKASCSPSMAFQNQQTVTEPGMPISPKQDFEVQEQFEENLEGAQQIEEQVQVFESQEQFEENLEEMPQIQGSTSTSIDKDSETKSKNEESE